MAEIPSIVIAPALGVDTTAFSEAVRRHHPDSQIITLSSDATEFIANSDDPELTGFGWSRLFVALAPERLAFVRGLQTCSSILSDSNQNVILLLAGSSIVLGRLDALVNSGSALTLLQRIPTVLPHDGHRPTNIDLINEGTLSPVALAFSSKGRTLLDDLLQIVLANPEIALGQALELTTHADGVSVIDDPTLAIGWWRPPTETMILLDLEGFSPSQSWMLRHTEEPARVRLSSHPELASAIAENIDQLGLPIQISLPSGLYVDEPMREITSTALATSITGVDEPFPDPIANEQRFLSWANDQPSSMPGASRHLDATYRHRSDLRAAYPEAAYGNVDRLIEWSLHRAILENRPPDSVMPPPLNRRNYSPTDAGRKRGGVNLIGYLDRASGLGTAARSLSNLLTEAGIPVSHVALPNTESSIVETTFDIGQQLRYRTNVIVATAEQTELIEPQLGIDVFSGRKNIGYWFWEVSKPSPQAVGASERFDSVWAPSKFIHDCFSGALACPVQLVPLPFPEVTSSKTQRSDLSLPEDRFIFLTAFDLLSAIERKNPFSAIEAFTRAFEEGSGPLLVIKTMNGDRRWEDIDRLHAAIDQRSDIVLIDGNFAIEELHSLIHLSDCFVSLHRAEGLGLHLFEALALGTPVISTGYSGPLDFLDEATAALVPFELVQVGSGGAYPSGSEWAEPEVAAAAAAIRRIHDEQPYRETLTKNGLIRAQLLREQSKNISHVRRLLR